MRKEGRIDDRVDDLSSQISDWVNSQVKPASIDLSRAELASVQATELMLLESDAMREILPWAEESEREIGPSGGYEDN